MLKRTGRTLSMAAVALAVGCASPNPFEGWSEQDADRWPLKAGRPGAHQNQGQPESLAPATLPEDAGVEDYVRLALKRNPAIAQARHRVAARLQQIPQVTRLEDPMLMVSPIGDMAETAAGQVGVMTGISQTLPFPGKLATRERIALQQAKAARADLAGVQLRVVADTRRAYWNYYYAQHAIDVTDQNRGLLKQFQQTAEAAYRTGTATQQDVLRASVEVSELTNELITLRQRRETAAARLNALIDRMPVNAPLPPPQPVELRPIDLALEPLIALATETNPELARIRHEIAGARQQQKLAGLDRWPNLNVGLNYNFVDDEGLAPMANGDDQWWLTFGINVPIWFEKYEAAEAEARHELFAALADLHRAHNHHAAHLQELLVQVETQQRLVVLFRDVLIPQTRQALEASLSAYQAGNLEFLSIVDNWRNLLRYQQLYHNSLAELEKVFADLEEVVGQQIPRQPTEPQKPDEAVFIPRDNNAPVEAATEQQQ